MMWDEPLNRKKTGEKWLQVGDNCVSLSPALRGEIDCWLSLEEGC